MIEIVKGRIQNQDTDIIVNSSNEDLAWENTTMNGDIHIKAGQDFTVACRKWVEENGRLHIGDIVSISEVGNLKCKEVWNVYSPWWDAADQYIYPYISMLDNLVLKFRDSEFDSISVPLIGCGAFMIPENFVMTNVVGIGEWVFSNHPKLYRVVTYTEKQYELANMKLDEIRTTIKDIEDNGY